MRVGMELALGAREGVKCHSEVWRAMAPKREIPLPHLKILEQSTDHPMSCAVPGCPFPGECRAPLSPQKLYEYQWFCRAHARAFNEAWNFFAGKSPGEIESHIRKDTIGDRPTRTYSLPPGMERIWRKRILRDFSFGRDQGEGDAFLSRSALPKDVRDALAVFGYGAFPGQDKLRARYRALAKEHHPDRHGGSPESEEKIKKINNAWRVLKDFPG